MVVVKSFTPRGTIEIGVRRFVKSDFGWRLSPLDDVIALAPTSRIPTAPLTAVLIVNAESRLATLTWTMDESKTLRVTGFDIQVSRDEGNSWKGIGSEQDSESRVFETGELVTAQNLKYRVRAREGVVPSDWTESNNVDIEALTLGGLTGPQDIFIWRLTDARREPTPREELIIPETITWDVQEKEAANDISPWLDAEPIKNRDYNPYEKVRWAAVAKVDIQRSRQDIKGTEFAEPYVSDIFARTNILYRRGEKPNELPDADGAL